jgi:hypothetical protein
MPYECFVSKKFKPDSLAMIDKANTIIAEYRRQGFVLSLRQLYYQLVSRDIIPNNLRSYKNLGNLVSDARLAGLIDWLAIEDRGREYILPQHWSSPDEIIRAAARGYKIDKWANQPVHIEVMVEKDALSGVLLPVTNDLDIGLTANKGYSSSSAMWEAGRRIRRANKGGKEVHILYLGDHDPSGMDMTRDVRERLLQFGIVLHPRNMRVNRLALNMDQVEQYGPPENPAKQTDSRADAYIEQFGYSSWELDALEPSILAALVTEAVMGLRDPDLWGEKLMQERTEAAELLAIQQHYTEVRAHVDDQGWIKLPQEGDDEE